MKHNNWHCTLLLAALSLSNLGYAEEQRSTTHDIWTYVDFDVAMATGQFPDSIRVTKQVIGIDGATLLSFFRALYVQNNLSNIQPQQELKIPKIIHQVWLGGQLPDAFKKYAASWIDKHMHGGWSYKLWIDEDVKTFNLYNQEYYDATDSVGVKSDLLKWEVVYRYGGVYVDVDFECLQPLDVLHYTYDFYTGIQPLDTQFIQLGAALFAGYKKHPILKHCIETVKDDWHHKGTTVKTGPLHFTKSFYAVAGKDGSIDIALPASYCYPQGCMETELKYKEWVQAGAYAIHHWAKSWMPKEYRKKTFRNLNNDAAVKAWND